MSSWSKIKWCRCAWPTHLLHEKNVEVSRSQVEALVLSIEEAKAHSEDGQGQGEQPSKDKQDGPYGEAGGHEDNSDIWFTDVERQYTRRYYQEVTSCKSQCFLIVMSLQQGRQQFTDYQLIVDKESNWLNWLQFFFFYKGG